jgi:hypothetical protein
MKSCYAQLSPSSRTLTSACGDCGAGTGTAARGGVRCNGAGGRECEPVFGESVGGEGAALADPVLA